jgi:hypothetical protein
MTQLCTACRYHKQNVDLHECWHPMHSSPVDGAPFWVGCEKMRADDGRCGPAGWLFAAAEPKGE